MEENIDIGGFPNLSLLDSSLKRLEGKVGGRGMEAPDRFSRFWEQRESVPSARWNPWELPRLGVHCSASGETGEVRVRNIDRLKTLLQSFLELQQGQEKENDPH